MLTKLVEIAYDGEEFLPFATSMSSIEGLLSNVVFTWAFRQPERIPILWRHIMRCQLLRARGLVALALALGALATGGVSATPVIQYSWNLDTNPGWAMEGEWQFGQPQGLGGDFFGYPDPAAGATGSNVCGINLVGDYELVEAGPRYLTTGAIDCSGLTQVSLHFQRWLNSDWQPWTTTTIEVSTDGLSWTELWNNGFVEVTDNAWSEQVFDLSAVADNQAAVYIRWGHEITQAAGAWAYSGWNIDDVEIYGEASGGPTDTVTAALNCLPDSGQLPFSFTFQAQLGNPTAETRRVAGRVGLTTGGGSQFANWRSGFTNLTAGDSHIASWTQNLPALATLEGANVFTLLVEDVTPAPYNQPPYLPSADTDTAQCTVTGTAP
jgi:hypothetical protein